MRRLELCLLVSGVMVFAACGSSSSPSKDGGAGKGGSGGASGAGGSSGTSGGSGGSSGTGGVAGGGGTAGGGSGGGGAIGTAGMDGGAGSDAATDAPVDMAPTTDAKTDATDGGGSDALVLTTQEQRGQYLVNVLGCTGCHGTNLAGKSMFAHDTNTNGYLSSANLTNDVSGLKNVSDQAIIDAITQGKDPDAVDGGTQYLFANMPWYQFANLTTADAQAIVAYLGTVPAVSNFPAANTGFFATQPTSPQWTPITLASLPNPVSPTVDGGTDAGTDAGAVPASNGKYLAGLLCVTCHTPDTAATSPLMLDVTRAYQGGRATTVSITVPIDGGADAGDAGDAATTTTVSESIGSANLTPDSTGLGGWTVAQVSTAITAAKDNQNRAICGMRANTALTVQDVTDIVVYLQTIPPVANTPAPTCY